MIHLLSKDNNSRKIKNYVMKIKMIKIDDLFNLSAISQQMQSFFIILSIIIT